MTQAASLEGRLLGPYRVGRRLGAGGIGAVYEAQHSRTGRVYALKVLLPEASAGEQGLERFRREARALGALGHAGIVSVHDFDVSEDGTAYMVMDRLVGCDLADRLEQGAMSIPRALAIFDELCSALGSAHDRGILHRDLKPSNVFLAELPGAPERAVLLDFGLAKNMSGEDPRLTASGATMGTPLYMAPEQARGAPVDRRADVYALGCILYEMLGGRPPFTGPTLTAILSKVLTEPPPPLRSLRPELPAALEEVVHRALAKHPDERPPTVDALRAAVRESTQDFGPTPLGARPSAPYTPPTIVATSEPRPVVGLNTPRSLRPRQARSLAVAAGAFVFGALAIGGLGAAYVWLGAIDRPRPTVELVPSAPVPATPIASAKPERPTPAPAVALVPEVATPARMSPRARTPPGVADERPPEPPVPPALPTSVGEAILTQQRALAEQQMQQARAHIAELERFRPVLRSHAAGLDGDERPRWCDALPSVQPFLQVSLTNSLASGLDNQRLEVCRAHDAWSAPSPEAAALIAALPRDFARAREALGRVSSGTTDEQRAAALRVLDRAERAIAAGARRFPCRHADILALQESDLSSVRSVGNDVRRTCAELQAPRVENMHRVLRSNLEAWERTLDALIGVQREIITRWGGAP